MVKANKDLPWRKSPPQAPAFAIGEFCAAHRLSPSMYFKLKAEGSGPREMHVGTRRMISTEAAAAWRRARERETPRAAGDAEGP